MSSRVERITLEIEIAVSVYDPTLDWNDVVADLDHEIVAASEDMEVFNTQIVDSWPTR